MKRNSFYLPIAVLSISLLAASCQKESLENIEYEILKRQEIKEASNPKAELYVDQQSLQLANDQIRKEELPVEVQRQANQGRVYQPVELEKNVKNKKEHGVSIGREIIPLPQPQELLKGRSEQGKKAEKQ